MVLVGTGLDVPQRVGGEARRPEGGEARRPDRKDGQEEALEVDDSCTAEDESGNGRRDHAPQRDPWPSGRQGVYTPSSPPRLACY